MSRMKKLVFITAVLLLTFTVAACGNNSSEINEPGQEEENNENGETDPAGENGRYLVLFVSRSGNTQGMAELISETLDCDIVEVSLSTPYEENYDAMLERGKCRPVSRRGSMNSVPSDSGQFYKQQQLFLRYNYLDTALYAKIL